MQRGRRVGKPPCSSGLSVAPARLTVGPPSDHNLQFAHRLGPPCGRTDVLMTMLDRMRRHRNWLKWSLGLVVLAFIALYFPDFIRAGASTSSNAEVARVGDERITAGAFRRV